MATKEIAAVGVDLGGTTVKVGLVDSKGRIVRKAVLDTFADEGPDRVVKQIKKCIYEVLKPGGYKIKGIGIGAPGVVQLKDGIVENPPNFPGWTKVKLGKKITEEFKLASFVDNDANAAAIGELIFGAGKKFDSFIMITLGTGVGGGIVLEKKLFRGSRGFAGEIGHASIDYAGPQCKCGSYGCIETYAGNNYLTARVKDALLQREDSLITRIMREEQIPLTPKIISRAMEAGDEFAISVVEDLGRKLGFTFANVANILDVTNFVVGGGVAGFGKRLFTAMEDGAKDRVGKSLKSFIKIVPAKLKNEAGILGASALVYYKYN